MATQSSINKKGSNAVNIPRLLVQVNNFKAGSAISNLGTGHPADPVSSGLYFWGEPNLMLFTRDMTQEILDMNPVVVMSRILPKTRNSKKANGRGVKREVIPGNSKNNSLQYHGGSSATNRSGASPQEVDNFIPITKTFGLGYNDVLYSKYVLPVNRFVNDYIAGVQFSGPQSAIYAPDWHDRIAYTQHRRARNYYMKFSLRLAVPNPKWTSTNHLNKWIFGEGQTVIVEPKLQTFNPDGSGNLEYYVAWDAKVVN